MLVAYLDAVHAWQFLPFHLLQMIKKKPDERNYDPAPNFRDSIKIAEQKTKDSITNQNKFTLSDRDDNEFFKNLYENNLTAHRPNIISKEKTLLCINFINPLLKWCQI